MMIDFENLIKRINVRGVIHVGAHEGGETVNYVKNRISDVVLIEANPDRFKNLTESINTGRHCVWCSPLRYEYFNQDEAEILKKYIPYNYAITDRESGTIKFNLSNFDGGTDSVFKINDWGTNSSWAPYQHIAEIEVPTTTLDKLIQDKQKYNFLNIDVEGAELLVLKGAIKLLKNVDAIILEAQDRVRFEGSCTRQEITDFLQTHGFTLDHYQDTGNHWGDCLFLKKQSTIIHYESI